MACSLALLPLLVDICAEELGNNVRPKVDLAWDMINAVTKQVRAFYQVLVYGHLTEVSHENVSLTGLLIS